MAEVHTAKGEEEEKFEMLELAQKYAGGVLRAPTRRMSHRFWTTTSDSIYQP